MKDPIQVFQTVFHFNRKLKPGELPLEGLTPDICMRVGGFTDWKKIGDDWQCRLFKYYCPYTTAAPGLITPSDLPINGQEWLGLRIVINGRWLQSRGFQVLNQGVLQRKTGVSSISIVPVLFTKNDSRKLLDHFKVILNSGDQVIFERQTDAISVLWSKEPETMENENSKRVKKGLSAAFDIVDNIECEHKKIREEQRQALIVTQEEALVAAENEKRGIPYTFYMLHPPVEDGIHPLKRLITFVHCPAKANMLAKDHGYTITPIQYPVTE